MSKKVDDKDLEKIRKDSFQSPTNFVTYADKWLRDNGVITPVLHNNLIINLYVNFPKAKYIEYYMDPDALEIEIYFHLTKLPYLFTKEAKLERQARELISQYLPDYHVTARKRKFSGGEKV